MLILAAIFQQYYLLIMIRANTAIKPFLYIPKMLFCIGDDDDWFKLRMMKPKEGILDLKQLTYKPVKPLVFQNGKCLIYSNKQYLLTTLYLYSHLTAQSVYVFYLMINNPFYLTFPASLPLMFFYQLFLLRRVFLKQKRYRPVIQQIYLHETGETVEVHYANKITRKLKDLKQKENYFIPFLYTPTITENEEPFYGDMFPQSEDQIRQPNFFEYAWTKYYANRQNHFMIPRRYNYANMEVLIQVFQGKIITT